MDLDNIPNLEIREVVEKVLGRVPYLLVAYTFNGSRYHL